MKAARSTPRRLSVPPPSAFHTKSPDHSEATGAAAKRPEAEPTPPPTPQGRITIADIKERRAKAGRLNAPTAASCNADMFKAPVCTLTLGLPLPPYPYSLSHDNNKQSIQEDIADAMAP
jgi:hypothetical protein